MVGMMDPANDLSAVTGRGGRKSGQPFKKMLVRIPGPSWML
jgi:hypothetical protein